MSRNDFLVVNQFTVTGTKKPRRPDLVVMVNGLPLGLIELKNPADTQADVWKAFSQLQTYKEEISDLLVFNEALVVSDGMNARVGSLTASEEWFMPWRTIKDPESASLQSQTGPRLLPPLGGRGDNSVAEQVRRRGRRRGGAGAR